MRLGGLLLVSVLGGLVAAVSASAEIRTGSQGNRYLDEEPAGSPTRPQFESVRIR